MTTNLPVRLIDQNLVIQHPNPNLLRSIFPKVKVAKIGDKTFSAIPHTLDAVRVLRNLGVPAPSPIRTEYDWPGRYKPRWYQIDTAEFFTINSRAHCHSAPRVGKTLSSLWAADYLRKVGKINRTLIVAPLSTLWDVWEQTIFESFPLRTFCVLHGPRKKRLELLEQPHDFYIINHHGIALIEAALRGRKDINHSIIDECFPAGTKVLTPNGERCIETLKEGDYVESSWGPMPVTHVFKKESTQLIKVNFDDGTSIVCTPEHPFATDRGWIAASQSAGANILTAKGLSCLRETLQHQSDGEPKEASEVLLAEMSRRGCENTSAGENMPNLWCKVHCDYEESVEGVLLKSMWDQVKSNWNLLRDEGMSAVWQRISSPDSSLKISTTESLFEVLQHEAELENSRRSNESRSEENFGEIERSANLEQGKDYAGTCTREVEGMSASKCFFSKEEQERERHWHDGVRKDALEVSSRYVRQQPSNNNRNETRERISLSLQSGLWRSLFDGSNRSRWIEPQYAGTEGAGSEERRVPLYVRVESIQNIEQTGTTSVWNLEVAGPQDYIADGKVVHNCAVFRNTRADTLFKPLNRVLNQQGILRSAWGLTGTPTPNDPTDAFGQCKLITPENYKGHFTSFKHETMVQFGQFKWVPRRGAEETVARVLKPSIRFERSVCTDMEPCYIERRASLSDEQTKAYKQLLNEAVTQVRTSTITAVNSAVLISKILQTAAGVVIDANGEFVRMDFGPRLSVLEELIEENNEKVLVFVPFTGALDALAQALRKKWSVGVVDGRVSAGKRTEIFREFRSAKDPHILVCHPQVMAHGLDLTAATLSIWYAPTWKAETYQQANARTDGSRQTVKIDIAHIFATAEEKRIYQVLKEKGRLQDVVLGLANKEVV